MRGGEAKERGLEHEQARPHARRWTPGRGVPLCKDDETEGFRGVCLLLWWFSVQDALSSSAFAPATTKKKKTRRETHAISYSQRATAERLELQTGCNSTAKASVPRMRSCAGRRSAIHKLTEDPRVSSLAIMEALLRKTRRPTKRRRHEEQQRQPCLLCPVQDRVDRVCYTCRSNYYVRS